MRAFQVVTVVFDSDVGVSVYIVDGLLDTIRQPIVEINVVSCEVFS